MAIEIVDIPMKNGDFHSYDSLPEGSSSHNTKASHAPGAVRWTPATSDQG